MKVLIKRAFLILLSVLICLNAAVIAFAEAEEPDIEDAPQVTEPNVDDQPVDEPDDNVSDVIPDDEKEPPDDVEEALPDVLTGYGWIGVTPEGSVYSGIGSADEQIMVLSSNYEVHSVEEAAAYVTEKMVHREAGFSYDYPNAFATSATTQEAFQAELNSFLGNYMNNLLKLVYAHGTNPEAGDYLQWSLVGQSYLPPNTASFRISCSARSSGGKADVTITITALYYTNREQEEQVGQKISEVIASLEIDGKSNYEKIKAVHDWIVENVSYDYEHLNDNGYPLKQTAYAAITDGKAVCQGYATLFYRMMLTLGIDCRVVTGKGNAEDHAWNIVKICDKYYNIDCTWDSTGSDRDKYFLKNNSDFGNHTPESDFLGNYSISAVSLNTSDPESAHSGITVESKDPDCIHDGYKDRKTCKTCGEVFSEGETLPANGVHNYQNGKCTVCGKEQGAFTEGDVNEDGQVNLADAVAILRYLAHLPNTDTFNEDAADYDGNTRIELADAIAILRMLAHIS